MGQRRFGSREFDQDLAARECGAEISRQRHAQRADAGQHAGILPQGRMARRLQHSRDRKIRPSLGGGQQRPPHAAGCAGDPHLHHARPLLRT